MRAKWAIAFLIGLATVTAASFTWRAAQIGSTAAYDDRQSISETVRAEQGEVERTIAIAAAAREYVRYRADYGVAAALDREAARLAAAGSSRLADVSRGGGGRAPGGCDSPRRRGGRVRPRHDRQRSPEAERDASPVRHQGTAAGTRGGAVDRARLAGQAQSLGVRAGRQTTSAIGSTVSSASLS